MKFGVDFENVARGLLWPIRALGSFSSSKEHYKSGIKTLKALEGRIDIKAF